MRGAGVLPSDEPGFEGFVSTGERLEPDDLSVADRPDVSHESVDRHAAGLPGDARTGHYQHAVLVLDELLGVASESVAPDLAEVLPIRSTPSWPRYVP